MLQDLDQRSANGAGSLHDQVRSAPGHQRVHPIWWIASAVLVSSMAGVGAWLWLRAPSPPQTTVVPPAPPPQRATASQPIAQAAPTASAEKPAPVLVPAVPPVVPVKIVAAPETPETADIVSKPPVAVAPAPRHTPAVRQDKPAPARPAPAVGTAVAEPPAVPVKQVKEFTPYQRAENLYRKAVGLMEQQNLPEAIDNLEQALQLAPNHAAARQTLVGLLLENRQQDRAVRVLQEGLNVDTGQPGLAMILARLQVERGDARAAIETLQRTLPQAGERADYLAFLAALLQRASRHQEAANYYQAALRRQPDNGVWWMGLGISLQADNRPQEAREAFSRAKTSNALSAELQAFVEQKLNQLAQ